MTTQRVVLRQLKCCRSDSTEQGKLRAKLANLSKHRSYLPPAKAALKAKLTERIAQKRSVELPDFTTLFEVCKCDHCDQLDCVYCSLFPPTPKGPPYE